RPEFPVNVLDSPLRCARRPGAVETWSGAPPSANCRSKLIERRLFGICWWHCLRPRSCRCRLGQATADPLFAIARRFGMIGWSGMMRRVDGVFTVRVWGEIDLASAHRFRDYLLGAVSMAHDRVLVDLCGVRHLDSSAVHALVAACAAADLREVRFDVAADGL